MIGLGSDENSFVHEDFGAGKIPEIKSVNKIGGGDSAFGKLLLSDLNLSTGFPQDRK